MTLSPRTVSIIAALFLSGSFIALGYYLSSPLSPRFANAISNEELLKAYSQKDTDADGLPDWQEELYGTDPQNPHSTGPDETDAEAVASGTVKPRFSSEALPEAAVDADAIPGSAPAAGSLTEQMSRAFLMQALSGDRAVGDQASQKEIVNSLMGEFSQRAASRIESRHSTLSIQLDASKGATAYAGEIESIFRAYPVPASTADPLALMEDLLIKGDESAVEKLEALAKSYRQKADALERVNPPTTLSAEHLSLLRSYDTLANATFAMAENYETDPIVILGALAFYRPAASGITDAIIVIANAVIREGVPAEDAEGYMLLELARYAESL